MRRNSCNYILNYLTKQLATNPDRAADTAAATDSDADADTEAEAEAEAERLS